MQTQKVTSFPIVLARARRTGAACSLVAGDGSGSGTISAVDLELLTVTDDVDEAVAAIVTADTSGTARGRPRSEVAAPPATHPE